MSDEAKKQIAEARERKTGKVDNVQFTHNSPYGEQYTTIDGERYMTWFDGRKHAVRAGVTVEHEPYDGELRYNGTILKYRGTKIVQVHKED